MKQITIRELHSRTGHWVRQAAQIGEILVTDHGEKVARLVPEPESNRAPYYARRILRKGFKRLEDSGKLRGGQDSTTGISEDREDRSL